jgi:predicted aconitase
MVTVPFEIAQTPEAAIVTVSPELDVALTANVVLYTAGDAGAGKVIAWLASAAVTVRTTFVAAL